MGLVEILFVIGFIALSLEASNFAAGCFIAAAAVLYKLAS